jgi:hypothetical protein
MRESTLASGKTRLLARPLVRDALRVRGLAAFARDRASLGSIQECKTSEILCRHGTLVC